jgi:hypothetical protein
MVKKWQVMLLYYKNCPFSKYQHPFNSNKYPHFLMPFIFDIQNENLNKQAMKKIMLIAIIIIAVSGIVRSAVVPAKQQDNIIPFKKKDDSTDKFVYKENIADDLSTCQYVYGAGMPVVCNYY